MKFELRGKVTARMAHKVRKSDGSEYDIYNLEIVEPGIYPSHFQVGTKSASMLGQADGPFGIGREVVCYGFVNGKKRVIEGAKGRFTKYDTYLTLTKIESAADVDAAARTGAPGCDALRASTPERGAASGTGTASGTAKDEIADDIPF